MPRFLNQIVKCSLCTLVFLMPLFFLPFSFEAFEFNKQYLLLFLTTIALLAWLAKMVVYDKEIRFKKTSLDVFVLAFLAAAAVSAIFSIDKTTSIFGIYGRFNNGLIGLMSLGVLYFLFTNHVTAEAGKQDASPKMEIKTSNLLNIFLIASGIAVLMSYVSILGLWTKLTSLVSIPPIMTQIIFNPVAGSLEGLSIFLAVVVSLLVGLMTSSAAPSLKSVIGWWLLLLASLGILMIVDFSTAWLVLLSTLVLYVGFSLWKRIFKESVNKLLIPISLILIAIAALFSDPAAMAFGSDANLANLPQEQVLSQKGSWQVAIDSVIANPKNIFIGSGLGTFQHDFSQYKPAEINNSWLWQIRFDKAGNYFAEILATAGFVGLLSYLAVIGLFLMMGYLLILGIKNISQAYPFQIPLLLAILALVVGQFVYYQNSVLAFAFWMILGLSMVSWRKPVKEKVISFKEFPEFSLILSTIMIILGIAALVLYFFAAKFYWADMSYRNALSLTGPERTALVERAVKLNPYFAFYRIELSRTYLYEALFEFQKPEQTRNTNIVQTRISNAIEQARQAINLQPNHIIAQENLAIIYREIAGMAGGALDWGIKTFEAALQYEPSNPALYTELGKLYVVKSDIENAKKHFNKAIEVKADYADAYIQLALLLEKGAGLTEAIAKLEKLVELNPLNVEGRFQLGRLYFNDSRIQSAIEQFQLVILLVPDYSNAYYALGVAYAAQGDKQNAIGAFEKVLELNPGNQDIIQKLNQLR